MTTDPKSPDPTDDDPLSSDRVGGGLPAGGSTAAEEAAGTAAPHRRAAPEPAGHRTDDVSPPRPKSGRVLASLALLVGLAALGGAGYLYYALIQTGDVRAAPRQVQALERRLDSVDQTLKQRMDQIAQHQQAALDEFRQQQDAARAATEQSLRQSLSEVARQAPPSTGEWQRAEAEYLLRIANHRLLLEHDVPGALRLLQAADSVLADLDDFALHEVRARIADEVATLQGVKTIDVQGLFLRLEAVKRHLDALPLNEPAYLQHQAAPPPVPAADQGWWEVLKSKLSRMVTVRHLEGPAKPLLAPEQALYLQLNLRLMLERAQLALVRREQMIYEESLATATDWVHRYLDTAKPSVQRMLGELTSLEKVDVTQPLPDISGSLDALKEVLRHPS